MTQGGKGMMAWGWRGMLGGLLGGLDVWDALDQGHYSEQLGLS